MIFSGENSTDDYGWHRENRNKTWEYYKGDQLFSVCAKFPEKLTVLTPCCFFQKIKRLALYHKTWKVKVQP